MARKKTKKTVEAESSLIIQAGVVVILVAALFLVAYSVRLIPTP